MESDTKKSTPEVSKNLSKKEKYYREYIRRNLNNITELAQKLGVTEMPNLENVAQLRSFVQSFQKATRDKTNKPKSRILSDGLLGPGTVREAKIALGMAVSRRSRSALQPDQKSATTSRPSTTSRPQPKPQAHPTKTRSVELKSTFEKLESEGFKILRFKDVATGYEVCAILPPKCSNSTVFFPGDGGTIKGYLKSSLLPEMLPKWESGSKQGLIIVEGNRKIKRGKYSKFSQKGTIESIINKVEKGFGKALKYDLAGFSRGGYALGRILETSSKEFKQKIGKVFSAEGVWQHHYAKVLVEAANKGIEVHIALGKRTKRFKRFFENNSQVTLYDNTKSAHWDVYRKHIDDFLS